MTDTSIYTDPTAMTKDNVQLSIWNGTKWVELSNGLTINQINANIGAVQDAVKNAQSGIAQATADAQNAVDTANDTATKVDGKVDDTTYQSGIAQLASDINLRVKSDDLLSQINIESGNILIQSNKIFLDAASVTFGGTAFITSAMVSSLSADDIVTGTMTAGAINLGNGTFSVDTNGNLIANDATLTGTLISGSSDSYNYEVSSNGIIFKEGITAFATLEGFAYGNNWEYVGLTGDNVAIGRVQGDALSGSYAYTDISTQNGIEFQRGNPFNSDMASSSISIGATTTSGMDAINLMTLNEASKASATVNIYGYDAENNKDTESIYMTVIDSNSKSSSIDVDSTGILLDSPNSTFQLDNSIENATTLWTSEPNGIKVSTSSSPISVTAGTELDLTASGGNVLVNATNGNLTLQSNGKFNIEAMDGTSILSFDTNASSGWIYANNLLWAKTALRTSYLWVEGKADINGVVSCQSLTQTSLLSKKTNISKLDTQDVINAVNSTEIYEYSFKDDLANGVNKRYASYIIDDVNDVTQYNEPSVFLSEDGKGRDDGTQLAYLTLMVQEMYKEIQELKTK